MNPDKDLFNQAFSDEPPLHLNVIGLEHLASRSVRHRRVSAVIGASAVVALVVLGVIAIVPRLTSTTVPAAGGSTERVPPAAFPVDSVMDESVMALSVAAGGNEAQIAMKPPCGLSWWIADSSSTGAPAPTDLDSGQLLQALAKVWPAARATAPSAASEYRVETLDGGTGVGLVAEKVATGNGVGAVTVTVVAGSAPIDISGCEGSGYTVTKDSTGNLVTSTEYNDEASGAMFSNVATAQHVDGTVVEVSSSAAFDELGVPLGATPLTLSEVVAVASDQVFESVAAGVPSSATLTATASSSSLGGPSGPVSTEATYSSGPADARTISTSGE